MGGSPTVWRIGVHRIEDRAAVRSVVAQVAEQAQFVAQRKISGHCAGIRGLGGYHGCANGIQKTNRMPAVTAGSERSAAPCNCCATGICTSASSTQRRVMYCSPGDSETLSPPESWSRSEEHTSELQSIMRISYAVFVLKKKK